MDEPYVRWIPLGGLGEIGMNCFALQQGEEILIVDCGVAFSGDSLGGDVIHPDFSWLVEHHEKIVGLVITHGHEDHIGGIPFLLAKLRRPLPIYAPSHARALILDKMEDQVRPADIIQIAPREVFAVGSFLCEGYSVAHSIIDALAMRIETNAGTILHTGDFDFDPEQPAGAPTDESGLKELGEEGVRLLLSDSTNIDSPRRLHSEGDVARELARLVTGAEQRVIVALFSSNIHRLSALGEVAKMTGRKLCFMGRSLERHQRVARRLGRLSFTSDLVVSAERLAQLPRNQVLLVAGGCQGESASALRRLSTASLPEMQVEAGDLVIMSSRAIPGNEKRVFSMLNDFARQGAQVITLRENSLVHVSGHASRAELAQMMRLVRPQSFIPVHGTLHHMSRHSELAKEEGIQDCLVVENGETVLISTESALQKGSPVQSGPIRISSGGLELSSSVRRRRGVLARQGVIFVTVDADSSGEIRATCSSLGVVGVDGDQLVLGRLRKTVEKVLLKLKLSSGSAAESEIRRVVRSSVSEINDERPVVEVHLRSPS